MCAILDANAASVVFVADSGKPPAAREFLKRIDAGRLRLVVGGKLFEELKRGSPGFRHWWPNAERAGHVVVENAGDVAARTEEVETARECVSDDPHVIALAQVGGARLLFTNDGNLQQDFKNPRLIGQPKGKVYTTLRRKELGRGHKQLLNDRNLCRA